MTSEVLSATEALEVTEGWRSGKDPVLAHLGEVLGSHIRVHPVGETPVVKKKTRKRIFSHAQAVAEACEAEED